MFSISGDVKRPGVYEVENGITVGELLELCGGMRGGQTAEGDRIFRPLRRLHARGAAANRLAAKAAKAAARNR